MLRFYRGCRFWLLALMLSTTGAAGQTDRPEACAVLGMLGGDGLEATSESPAMGNPADEDEAACQAALDRILDRALGQVAAGPYRVTNLNAARADAVTGITVYNTDGETIGDVTDVVDMGNAGAVIGVGGFLGLGEKAVRLEWDELFLFEAPGDTRLIALTAASQEEIESRPEYDGPGPDVYPDDPYPDVGAVAENTEEFAEQMAQALEEMAGEVASTEESSVDPIENLRQVRASRTFAVPREVRSGDFAGFGMLAFRRDPAGSLRERAMNLCHGFLIGIATVEASLEDGTPVDRQVVTLWPVETGEAAGSLNEQAGKDRDRRAICEKAVEGYDWNEGSDAIDAAAAFFEARGKDDIARRIGTGDQDGPWLLAWAPGAQRGSTEDDVLVLAFDLSYVRTQAQAERAFQAWRVAIEQNAQLWSQAVIANASWSAAIIRWANMIGRDLNFYARLTE